MYKYDTILRMKSIL